MGQQLSAPQSVAPGSSQQLGLRLYYLDNFRTYLTALVIYHHTAIPYGGSGSASYKSSLHVADSSPALVGFNVLNQSYFMGSFFFLSGYFSGRALQRKSPGAFLKTKAIKLGVPVVMYSLFGTPIIESMMRLWKGQPLDSGLLTQYWKSLRGVRGHVWYAATLFLFDAIEAIRPYRHAPYTDRDICMNVGLDVVSSFLIRLLYPVGVFFEPLRLQPAFLPQYISAYRLGASLDSPPSPYINRPMFQGLLATSMASAAVGLGLLLYSPDKYPLSSTWGGPNVASLAYCTWNETTGYLLGTVGLQIFRDSKLLNRSWGGVGKYSYAAFLVHMIVVSTLQTMTDGWNIGGIAKTALIGTAGTTGSWGVGWVLSKVPVVGQVVT